MPLRTAHTPHAIELRALLPRSFSDAADLAFIKTLLSRMGCSVVVREGRLREVGLGGGCRTGEEESGCLYVDWSMEWKPIHTFHFHSMTAGTIVKVPKLGGGM